MQDWKAIVSFQVCVFILLGGSGAAQAQNFFKKLDEDRRNAQRPIEKTIEKAGQDVGTTGEKAVHDTGNTIEKAFQDIGNALTAHPNNDDPKDPPFQIPIRGVECPYGRKATWRSYFAKPTVIGVQFRWAKNLEKPRALGGIDPAACYTVSFDPQKGYGSSRTFGYSRKNKPEYKDDHRKAGLPGNPNRFEVNVDGVVLRFNEAGEIYDLRGRVVGTFVCYLSNECEPYKY